MTEKNIELHPLKPFLPNSAQLLMLGSFPPQKKRWSINFYYPNWINDMWRIMGLIYFDDKTFFLEKGKKAFNKSLIITFLNEIGIGIFDTASAIRRLQDNASDNFLEVVTPTDIHNLLEKIPQCKAIVTTGKKATEVVCKQFNAPLPKIGEYTPIIHENKELKFFRMPSSSRAYPLKLEKKAAFYQKMMITLGMYLLTNEQKSRIFAAYE